MTIIIDLIILAIIALCVILGYIKGLTGVLIKIISFVLSIIIAFVLFVPISNLIINNTQIDEKIAESIQGMILENTDEEEKTMPTTITEYISEKVESAADSAKTAVAEEASKEVSVIIVKAGVWILLFLIARIILIVLKFITSLIAKLPVIKQFDKLGGVIYGLLEGLVIVYLVLAIISFISPITNGSLAGLIDNSFIGSAMYNNNLLLKVIF